MTQMCQEHVVQDLPLSKVRDRLKDLLKGRQRGSLLYPGSGNDVCCSVHLFWEFCAHFDLIDPCPLEVQHGGYLAGSGPERMKGFFYRCDAVDDSSAAFIIPTSPYVISIIKKQYRLSFNEWQKATLSFHICRTEQIKFPSHCLYDVALCKDYAGIEGIKEYPYEKIWSHLRRGGLFAETLAEKRTNREYDYAIYRFYGFTPLFCVSDEESKQIGFGSGFTIFQKNDDADLGLYLFKTDVIQRIYSYFQDTVAFPQIAMAYTLDDIKGMTSEDLQDQNPDQKRAFEVFRYALLQAAKEPKLHNWNQLCSNNFFMSWLERYCIPVTVTGYSREFQLHLVLDCLRKYNLEVLGPLR